jgi:D-glycero-D-manno-heptose 1,7-bisphosphate phosphatase
MVAEPLMKLVILDRDGVINEDSDDYIKSVAEWQPIPGSLEAIAKLSQAGYTVAIASNQSGIGRGLFDYDALGAMFGLLQRSVGELGGHIDLIEFCPDAPENATAMRKPAPGMLIDLAKRLQIPLDGVPFVGDSLSDVQAARAAGARPFLVLTGKGERIKTDKSVEDVEKFQDLAAFVAYWIART